MSKFDAIIIGAGQAGPSLAGRLTAAGRKVAMIERKLFGGTCVNTGCIPTKTLVASAYVAHKARTASEYGINAGSVSVDMKAVKARKDQVSGASRAGVEGWLRGMENCTVYTGHARFESPHEIRVGNELLSADQIFLNVGGRANIPQMPGIDTVPFLTNVGILELDTPPRHLIIVGGSYIEKEGIHSRLNAKCIRLEQRGNEIAVGVECESDASASLGSHVLLAVGRRPNTDDLNLEKAGVETDERGYIKVDDQLRTSVPGIWALGDCNGKGAFTHTSYNDFEIVAANLLDNDPRRVSDRIPAHCLYTDPPLGRAGMTEREVRASGKPAFIGTRPMTKVGRAVEKGESAGFLKILVDAESKRILGASLLGTGCDEVIHCILDVMYAKQPYTTISRAMHIHPTVSELIPTVLQDLKPLK